MRWVLHNSCDSLCRCVEVSLSVVVDDAGLARWVLWHSTVRVSSGAVLSACAPEEAAGIDELKISARATRGSHREKMAE